MIKMFAILGIGMVILTIMILIPENEKPKVESQDIIMTTDVEDCSVSINDQKLLMQVYHGKELVEFLKGDCGMTISDNQILIIQSNENGTLKVAINKVDKTWKWKANMQFTTPENHADDDYYFVQKYIDVKIP